MMDIFLGKNSKKRDIATIYYDPMWSDNVSKFRSVFTQDNRYKLYKDGNIIKFFTARGSTTNKDWSKLTKKQFGYWYKNSNRWIKDNIDNAKKFDFFITDLSPEVFELGRLLNIPCFGVCHFTWDWFYKKISKSIFGVLLISIISIDHLTNNSGILKTDSVCEVFGDCSFKKIK